MSYSSSMDLIEETVNKFGDAYNELTSLGGPNEMMDNVLQTYIDSIYRKRIAMICNIPTSLVDDTLLKYIEHGVQSERMIEAGKLAMFRRNFTDTEVYEIVQTYLENSAERSYAVNTGLVEQQQREFSGSGTNMEPVDYSYTPDAVSQHYDTQVQQPIEVLQDDADVSQPEEPVKPADQPTASAVEVAHLEVTNNNGLSLGNIDDLSVTDGMAVANVAPAVENTTETTIPQTELVIGANVEGLDRMGTVDKKVSELMDKYSNKVSTEDLSAAVSVIYKNVLSELTGIPANDIKEFVCNYVQSGIMEPVVEDGQEVQKRRPLTDEEASLIAKHLNGLSEEEANDLLNVNSTEPVPAPAK